MSRKVSLIEEINDTKETWKLAIKITNLWQVQGNPQTAFLEMIFVDTKGDKIQATVKNFDVPKWKAQLKEGLSYIVQNFQVETNNGQYKISKHPFKLVFLKGTIAKEHDLPEIPRYIFHFTEFEDILEGRASDDLLVDVIGQYVRIVKDDRHGRPKKLAVSVIDERSTRMTWTLWGDYCTQLCNVIDKEKGASIFILLTLAKIKDTKGEYPISIQNSMYGSKLLINDNLPEIQQFKERMALINVNHDASSNQILSQQSSRSQSASEDNFFYNAEVKTICQINELKKDCFCVTVAKIEKLFANEWSYEACSKCDKKVDATTLQCGLCPNKDSRTYPRFRLEVKVSQNGDSAKFILWDRECFQLINKTASQLKKQLQDEDEDDKAFPEDIDVVLGKTLAFKIKVQPNYRRASVNQVSEDANIIDSILKKFPDQQECQTSLKRKSISSIKKENDLDDTPCMSASGDYDPELVESLSPEKLSCDALDDIAPQESTPPQLSATKVSKHVKTK